MLASSTPSSAAAASLYNGPQTMAKLMTDLRSKGASTVMRSRAAKELFTLISEDMRDVPPDELNAFLDQIVTKNILELVKALDPGTKIGGILAIVALINADVCNTTDRISRYCTIHIATIKWFLLQ